MAYAIGDKTYGVGSVIPHQHRPLAAAPCAQCGEPTLNRPAYCGPVCLEAGRRATEALQRAADAWDRIGYYGPGSLKIPFSR